MHLHLHETKKHYSTTWKSLLCILKCKLPFTLKADTFNHVSLVPQSDFYLFVF